MSVAAEVLEDLSGTGEWLFRVKYPVLGTKTFNEFTEGLGVCEVLNVSVKSEFSFRISLLKHVEELTPALLG